jgi:hypothetical protein
MTSTPTQPTVGAPVYVCEWCVPSDLPETAPQTCRVIYCSRCGGKTWHWPEYPSLPNPQEGSRE